MKNTIRKVLRNGKAVVSILAALAVLASCAPEKKPEKSGGDVPVISGQKLDWEQAYILWQLKNKEGDYLMTVRYSARSPLAGIWEIEVSKKKVVGRKLDGVPRTDGAFTNLTMDYLFSLASRSADDDGRGPFLVTAELDPRGYVGKVGLIVNGSSKAPGPADQTYLYEVLDLK